MGPMNHQVIKDRTLICTKCTFWHSMDHCLKGHIIQSMLGCPIKQFPPVGGAGYATDRPAKERQEPGCRSCKGSGPMGPMETVHNLASTLNAWKNSGFELSTTEVQQSRAKTCSACQNYDGTRCKVCHCVISVKSRIAAARCPLEYW